MPREMLAHHLSCACPALSTTASGRPVLPQALVAPAPEARVHRGPRPVALGKVAPLAPRRAQEARDARPLRLRQLVPVCHAPLLDRDPADRRRHRAALSDEP